MAQNSYPFEDQPTTEAEYSNGFSRMQLTGVEGAPGTSGLLPFADSSGMQVKVPAGFAIVRGHFYENDAQEVLSISSSGASARHDIVVLRLDASVDSVLLDVVEGTPASSPTDPSLTQNPGGVWQEPLARVVVGASVSTISPGNVVDLRGFLGTQFGRWRTSTRPSNPVTGTAGYNTDTSQPELYSGSDWVPFTPSEISANIITSGALPADRISAGSIETDKLADSAVTNPKLATNAVTAAKIASNAVTVTKISAGAVTTAKLDDGAVTDAKVDSVDAGKITSGVLALARGGTGATSKAGAKTNIGIFVQSTQPTNPSTGDLWFY